MDKTTDAMIFAHHTQLERNPRNMRRSYDLRDVRQMAVSQAERARAAVAKAGLLTIAEAAQQYGVKPCTIRMACRQRRLPHRRIEGLFAIEPRHMALFKAVMRPRMSA